MDLNKFTQKSLQAVQDCQKLAYQYGNQKIDPGRQPDRQTAGEDGN